jgi:hypothetical protein
VISGKRLPFTDLTTEMGVSIFEFNVRGAAADELLWDLQNQTPTLSTLPVEKKHAQHFHHFKGIE